MRELLIGFLSITCFIGNAYADADGEYCVGKDFVAIDARGILLSAEGPTTQIVTIDSDGKLERHVLSTPPNLNKRLRCEESRIVLSDGHMIDLENLSEPVFREAPINNKSDFNSSLLPYIERDKAIKIDTTDKSHNYTLLLSHITDIPEKGMNLHHISARVVKSTRSGDFVSSKLLAEGIRLVTID
ncbi:hypothetical protein [Reinekea marinisedimentorum]|uniref:Uncharacterized protein n=1 Tax=Reinekea marinisedimentorum TaxID=230495 RepID=A0A4R3HRZ7_9GAMM|nr:hypothetical protein [Reinekea marinisedimentorum]TCS35082.1 hypothetical protein BCF53_1382 [Reinekea marinisedimentorum]